MSQPLDIDYEESLMKQFQQNGFVDVDSGRLVSILSWARNFKKDLTGITITFLEYNESTRRYNVRISR